MLTDDFLAGYISAQGSFMNIRVRNTRYPAFQIKSSIANYGLLLKISNSLGALNCVYLYTHGKQKYSLLLIRDRNTLLEKLIPLLDPRIEGYNKEKFMLWKDELLNTSSTWNFRTIKNTSNFYRLETENNKK
jgi:LAGLIDADG endonuclease